MIVYNEYSINSLGEVLLPVTEIIYTLSTDPF